MNLRGMLEANRVRADEVRAELAERQAHIIHRDDGHLTQHSVNMPTERPVKMAEVEARFATEREISNEIHGAVLAQERQRYREALAEERTRWRGETDRLVRKYDELLRCFNDLLNATTALEKGLAVDGRSAEVIDMPALPLRGRHG